MSQKKQKKQTNRTLNFSIKTVNISQILNTKQIQSTQPQSSVIHHLPQHRHSLTGRKVHRTRSSGASHHIWDDPMIEVDKSMLSMAKKYTQKQKTH